MSEAEHPDRARGGRPATIEDLRLLMGASTPHFALQLRNRIARLVDGLDPDDPVRVEGEREMARLASLGVHGERRGEPGDEALPRLPSLSAGASDPSASGTGHG